MVRHLSALRDDPALRRALVESGLETIRARHSCSHRVDELLGMLSRLDAAPMRRLGPTQHSMAEGAPAL
jgi:spore maturation protein CgeB